MTKQKTIADLESQLAEATALIARMRLAGDQAASTLLSMSRDSCLCTDCKIMHKAAKGWGVATESLSTPSFPELSLYLSDKA